MEKLINQIIEASIAYYTNGSSKLSDTEFDSLIEKLRSIEPNHPLLTMTGWGYKPVDGVKHLYHKIGGIDKKFKKIEDVPNFDSYIISAKLDGGSVTFYYKEGYLQKALTRGDGEYGRDITSNVLGRVPIKLNQNLTGYVRCEAVISIENFSKYFPEAKSSRNSAVGLIGADNPNKELLQYVDLIPINVYIDGNNCQKGSIYYQQVIKQFPVYLNYLGMDKHLKDILTKETMEKLSGGYLCDGLVIEKPDHSDCFAFKFDDETAIVKVTKVEWNTQSTGKIFPTVYFEPVEISGCIASKATGKSYEFIKSNKIGPDALVKIVRSGEVIPNILEVIEPSNTTQLPICSYNCDTFSLKIDGANAYCTNPECPSIINGMFDRLIMTFAPKGFSDEMLLCIKYYCMNSKPNESILNTLLDILNMLKEKPYNMPTIGNTEHQQNMITDTLHSLSKLELTLKDLVHICSIEGFGDKLSEIMEDQIINILKIDLNKFCFNTLKLAIVICPNSRARESWEKYHDRIKLILNYFTLIPSIKKKEIDYFKVNNENGIVCITGKLEGTTKEEFAKTYILPKNYEWTKDIKNATILINAGDRESSKIKTAKKKGIKVVSVEEFLQS